MLKIAPAFCLFLLSAAPPATAEPISATFDILISQKCSAGVCSPYSVTFPLTLTFDSAVTAASDDPTAPVRQYGAATFSNVPLDRPAVQPGATEIRRTVDLGLLLGPSNWRHVGHAQQSYALSTATVDYFWYLGIYEVVDGLPTAPLLTAESLIRLLGRGGNPLAFGYAFSGQLAGDETTPDSVSYSGEARLANPAPVPEPATLLLLGSGAVAVLARRRRSAFPAA